MSDPAAWQRFTAALAGAGRRWRWRMLAEGAVRIAGAALVAGGAAVAVIDRTRFEGDVVDAARLALWALLAVLGLRYLLLPVPWRRDPRRVARHLERRDPSLDALLVTAVEVGERDPDASLSRRLFRQAASVCADPSGPGVGDRRALRRAGGVLLALLLAAVAVLWLGTPGWRHGALLLALPWHDARLGSPYVLEARPGSVTRDEGSDLQVRGLAQGFAPSALTLVHRADGDAQWTRVAMQPDPSPSSAGAGRRAAVFEAMLPSLSAPVAYYLEAGSVRTPEYRVGLRWLPRAQRLDHRYRYPAYTGLGERRVERATDIAAVSGTQVQVRVLPALAAPGAASGDLVLDDTRRRALVVDGEALVASLAVDEAERYRVELRAADGRLVPVTPDHVVTVLADGAPTVSVLRPQGEARVTAVEEMQVAVRAEDDVGLRALELVLSVNGGPEEVVPLTVAPGAASVDGLHTLYLETRDLTPGDLIAFHARASDGVVARTAVSDIHFMEVRPFDRDYSRGRSGGGRQGGAGQQDQNLAAQQRALVIALFRLARDHGRLSDDERSGQLATLAAAQARIRERVEAIVRRLRGRGMVQSTPGYQVMLEEMPRATAAMLRVEALLAVPDPDGALPPAREALSHLQRSDAAFREVEVTARQGGGGQGRADNDDLSRLFQLEIDRLRNRYSDVQRAQAPAPQQQLDEAIARLEELARRQRREVERARRRAADADLSGSGAPSQAALARELDELLRRLQRLTRERPGAATEAAREALQQAARAMQDSAAGDAGAAQAALDRLREAREALDGDGPVQQARELEQARRTAEALVERQAAVRRRLAEAPAGTRPGEAPAAGDARAQGDSAATGGAADPARDAARPGDPGAAAAPREGDLAELKQRMEDDARALRESLDRLAGDRSGDRDAARGARRAAGILREQDVEGRLRRSREELVAGIAPDRELERGLGDALERVREEVAAAARAAAHGSRAGQEAATAPPSRETMRALRRDLGDLQQRLRDAAHGQGVGPGGRDASDLDALAGRLDRLRGIASNAAPAGDLEALVRGIEALAADDGTADPAALLAALEAVERALAGGADAAERSPAGDDGRPPPGYGSLVDEYYRRLGGMAPDGTGAAVGQ